ncbi:hypothetical protein AHAS_Ahas02G0100100 [Arachis hypogaea]
METILQNHSKLDSNIVAEVIKSLVETDPSIKLPKGLAGKTEVHSQSFWWLKRFLPSFIMVILGHGSEDAWLNRPNRNTIPVNGSEEADNVRILHRIFWSFNPCIMALKQCKPLVQVDGTHLYEKHKCALLVAIAKDGNQNIVPIAFTLVEGETTDIWPAYLGPTLVANPALWKTSNGRPKLTQNLNEKWIHSKCVVLGYAVSMVDLVIVGVDVLNILDRVELVMMVLISVWVVVSVLLSYTLTCVRYYS